MTKNFSIAIDGPAGAGKTTQAKALAKALGFVYVDTGAMYRALAVYMQGEELEDVPEILPEVNLQAAWDEEGNQRMSINGVDVTDLLRTPEISRLASDISTIQSGRAGLAPQPAAGARDLPPLLCKEGYRETGPERQLPGCRPAYAGGGRHPGGLHPHGHQGDNPDCSAALGRGPGPEGGLTMAGICLARERKRRISFVKPEIPQLMASRGIFSSHTVKKNSPFCPHSAPDRSVAFHRAPSANE